MFDFKIYSIEYHRNGSDADGFYCIEAGRKSAKGFDDLIITFETREINEKEFITKETIRVISLNDVAFRWQGASFADDITQRLKFHLEKQTSQTFYDLIGCKLDKKQISAECEVVK